MIYNNTHENCLIIEPSTKSIVRARKLLCKIEVAKEIRQNRSLFSLFFPPTSIDIINIHGIGSHSAVIITDSSEKSKHSFYFKGFKLSCKSMVLNLDIKEEGFSYVSLDNKIHEVEQTLRKNIIFDYKEAKEAKKVQISIIESLRGGDYDVFQILLLAKREDLIFRPIDFLEEVSNNHNIEIMKSIEKSLIMYLKEKPVDKALIDNLFLEFYLLYMNKTS